MRDPDDRRVQGEQKHRGVLLPNLTVVHPGPEEVDRATPERIEHIGEALERERAESAGLSDEHRELRPLGGEVEHGVDHGFRALPVPLLALECTRDLLREPDPRRLQARFQQRVLVLEVVQEGLLADADGAGDVVEARASVALTTELPDRLLDEGRTPFLAAGPRHRTSLPDLRGTLATDGARALPSPQPIGSLRTDERGSLAPVRSMERLPPGRAFLVEELGHRLGHPP